jgi:ribosomal protein S18 acetylase RimI-like enzyme
MAGEGLSCGGEIPGVDRNCTREKSGMTIERATLSDAEEILSLQELAYRSEAELYNDFSIPPLLQTLEEVRKDFENQVFLKTVLDRKIVGSVRAFMKEGTCYIGRLIVHPDFQNQGIGKELMNGIEETFKEARRFELFTGHKSEKNLHLYEKLGYRVFKTVKANERLTIVFLEKIKLSKEGRSRGH